MKTAIIQLEHNDNMSKSERINYVVDLINKLPQTDLILLPELWATGFFSYDQYISSCETVDGDIKNILSSLANKKNTYIFTGSFLEYRNGKLFNSAMLISRNGETVLQYSKIHLFDKEKQYVTPGSQIDVVKTELGTIGLSICYDLRFPEFYRKLSSQGADILLNAYALPIERAKHWEILSLSRAIENQAFFFSCGCAGINNGIQYAGHSMAISPTGEILSEGMFNKSDILLFDYDISQAIEYRNSFPALKDRIIK